MFLRELPSIHVEYWSQRKRDDELSDHIVQTINVHTRILFIIYCIAPLCKDYRIIKNKREKKSFGEDVTARTTSSRASKRLVRYCVELFLTRINDRWIHKTRCTDPSASYAAWRKLAEERKPLLYFWFSIHLIIRCDAH